MPILVDRGEKPLSPKKDRNLCEASLRCKPRKHARDGDSIPAPGSHAHSFPYSWESYKRDAQKPTTGKKLLEKMEASGAHSNSVLQT